ncbi:MAG: radical SAM protein [bacterium]|nr:radical SAM protein [bacterium]
MIIEKSRKEVENLRREKLKREKPLVFEKIMRFPEKVARGESVTMIDLCYDYRCNMHCAHCSNLSLAKKKKVLTIESLKDLSRQADEMGLAQFTISGGEPLTFPDIDDVISALNPEKFHLAMSTNGLLLDKSRAEHLKKIGLDKVKISLDSIDEKIYQQTRGKNEGYKKAIEALFIAREAGLQVNIQTVISHQTCRTPATKQIAEFCQKNLFNFDIMIAKAVGRWEGKEEVLLDEQDVNYLIELKKEYPMLQWDMLPSYGEERGGCACIIKNSHITKYGDFLPCGFIHISMGNIFEEPLKDIIERSFKIKFFHKRNPVCLAGLDRNFIKNYMSKFYGKPLPISWKEAFSADDFIK